MTENTCPQCGTPFATNHPAEKYCSPSCAWAANAVRKSKLRTLCTVCGRGFRQSGRGRPRNTCSDGCARRARLGEGHNRQRPSARHRPKLRTSSFPQGTCRGQAKRFVATKDEAFCAVCGHPAGDMAQWSTRAYRYSPRAHAVLASICPRHAGTDPRLIDAIIKASLWPRRPGKEDGFQGH